MVCHSMTWASSLPACRGRSPTVSRLVSETMPRILRLSFRQHPLYSANVCIKVTLINVTDKPHISMA